MKRPGLFVLGFASGLAVAVFIQAGVILLLHVGQPWAALISFPFAAAASWPFYDKAVSAPRPSSSGAADE